MKFILGSIISLFFIYSFLPQNVIRMHPASIQKEIVIIDTLTLELADTIPNKTIRIYKSAEFYPIKYSREITTGVCIDGECRLVNIELYWNVTGRYLGFTLPSGEFLSKTEHDPFNNNDYNRLHDILGDKGSLLDNYTIEELVPENKPENAEVDAVSSATVESILHHIVKGAVYTTYTLWHIVHGVTQTEIEKLSAKQLNADLALLILESENTQDKAWVLNNIDSEMKRTAKLQEQLMNIVAGDNIYLAERALNALKTENITQTMQVELATVFQKSGFLQQRIILQKLHGSDLLYPETIKIITGKLRNLNGSLTKMVLELYTFHNIEDDYSLTEIRKLLKSDNKFIVKHALRYLENLDNLDKKTLKTIEKTKRRIS